jgi:hypothetical protein
LYRVYQVVAVLAGLMEENRQVGAGSGLPRR